MIKRDPEGRLTKLTAFSEDISKNLNYSNNVGESK